VQRFETPIDLHFSRVHLVELIESTLSVQYGSWFVDKDLVDKPS